jgi:hypothetical protein
MSIESSLANETIECPLCLGVGELKRSEVLERLGVKDFARVAQLSAEEAFRLLLTKQKQDEQNVWLRFEADLTRRTSEINQRHRDELQALAARTKELEAAARVAEQQKVLEIQHANRRVEDSLREAAALRERNQVLEVEMSKVARVGKREEIDFAEEARAWAGICVSEKLPRNGDFILAYRDPSGAPLEPRMLVDNKDKAVICGGDIDKLVRDARECSIPVAALVVRSEDQLRQIDKDARWGCKEGVWILRTTRQWFPRDLDVLRPLFERMRVQGSDFLDKNVALAQEVRRTFADLDRVENELKKAAKAITSASGLVTKYRGRLQKLCDNAVETKMPPVREQSAARIAQ